VENIKTRMIKIKDISIIRNNLENIREYFIAPAVSAIVII